MLCVGFLFVFSCAQPQAEQADLLFCDGARPMAWSARDTRATKEQVDTHNRKWKRFCRRFD
jgi:hypothetical protein